MNFLDNGPQGVEVLREIVMALSWIVAEKFELTEEDMKIYMARARQAIEQRNAEAREEILSKETPQMRKFWEKLYEVLERDNLE